MEMPRTTRISKRRRPYLPQSWDELNRWQRYSLVFRVRALADYTEAESLEIWRSVRGHWWAHEYRPISPEYRAPAIYIRPPSYEVLMILVDDYGVPFDTALEVVRWDGRVETAPGLEKLDPDTRAALLARLDAWRELTWSGARVAP